MTITLSSVVFIKNDGNCEYFIKNVNLKYFNEIITYIMTSKCEKKNIDCTCTRAIQKSVFSSQNTDKHFGPKMFMALLPMLAI